MREKNKDNASTGPAEVTNNKSPIHDDIGDNDTHETETENNKNNSAIIDEPTENGKVLENQSTDKEDENRSVHNSETEEGSNAEKENSDDNASIAPNVPQPTGSLNVTQHGIPKRTKKKRTFNCEDCSETFSLVKQLNSHYKVAHPAHVFKCSSRNKTYASRNAQIRHERTHSGMTFSCRECSYTCLFKYELKNHMKKHTGTGLYPCLTRGCAKSFTTKKGMKQHMQVHQNLNLKCDVCDKDGFTTKGYLRQHKKGQHGDGFVSRCGAFNGKHPTARVIHQKECEDCIRILEDRRKMGDYSSSDSSSSSDEDTSSGDSVIPGSDSE